MIRFPKQLTDPFAPYPVVECDVNYQSPGFVQLEIQVERIRSDLSHYQSVQVSTRMSVADDEMKT